MYLFGLEVWEVVEENMEPLSEICRHTMIVLYWVWVGRG